jgi:hypothetical protein
MKILQLMDKETSFNLTFSDLDENCHSEFLTKKKTLIFVKPISDTQKNLQGCQL